MHLLCCKSLRDWLCNKERSKDHAVDRVWSKLNQLLASLGDLVVDESLLFLERLDILSNVRDLICDVRYFLFVVEDLVVVCTFLS